MQSKRYHDKGVAYHGESGHFFCEEKLSDANAAASAISGRPCLTVSMSIENGGEIIGVIGADLRLATA